MARAGRRPGPTRTKDAVLTVARAQFAARGYAATTVRSVAAGAGVNPALVHHHFGTKDQLFLAALQLPFHPGEVIEHLLAAGPRDEFPERLVRYFVGAWRDPVTGQALQAVLRRGVSDEDSAALLRNLVENVLLERAASVLGVPKLRVVTAMSHLIGLALAATILRVEPLASAGEDELVALVAPAIRGYLTA
ncbi:MAG: TetR family transcriptional regulator [Actinomycetota bacterium]